jgi:hypothetical protein
MNLLLRQFDAAVVARSLETTTIPALTRILLTRGRGEPAGIIDAALWVRERTNALRQWMGCLSAKLDIDPIQGYTDACKQVEALGRELSSTLGLSPSPSAVSIELSVWGAGVPGSGKLGIHPGSLVRLLTGGRHRKRAAVLSELAAIGSAADASGAYYDRLTRLAHASSPIHR